MIMQTMEERLEKKRLPFERGAPKFKERNMEISALYAQGWTYKQIGYFYSLCTARISQIVAMEDLNRTNGFRSQKKQGI